MKSHAWVWGMVAVLLAGCAAKPVALSRKAQSLIERADVVLSVPQNNLDVTVQATSAGNSGFIGALIVGAVDAKRQSNAEKEAGPLIEALREFDFRAAMLKSTTEAFGGIDHVLFENPTHVETVYSESSKRIAFDASSASAVLFVNVAYRLQSGTLTVSAEAQMYSKVDELKPLRNNGPNSDPVTPANAIYRGTFSYAQQAVTPENIAQILSEGATSIAQQIAADVDHGI